MPLLPATLPERLVKWFRERQLCLVQECLVNLQTVLREIRKSVSCSSSREILRAVLQSRDATLLSQVITTIKDSSYLANVATIELMARVKKLLSSAHRYNGLNTVNVSDVFVLFGFACLIYFIINFSLSCIVRYMQKRKKKAAVVKA